MPYRKVLRACPQWKTDPMRRWSFTKGHGTENDFVVLLDRESMLEVGPAEVRFICDCGAGIGADGLLRAVLAKHVDHWDGDGDLWFMDYRNADGSIAEMCGNGIRVLVRFLLEADLVSGPIVEIATRRGLRTASVLPDGRIRVSLGPVAVGNHWVVVTTTDGAEFKALPADVGNPHAVGCRFMRLPAGIRLRSFRRASIWSSYATLAIGTSLCASTNEGSVKPVPAAPARSPLLPLLERMIKIRPHCR